MPRSLPRRALRLSLAISTVACGGVADDAMDAAGNDPQLVGMPELGLPMTELASACTYDSATKAMTQDVADREVAVFSVRSIDKAILVNGFECVASGVLATTGTVKKLVVTATGGGNQTVILDYINGMFLSGTAAAVGVDIDLGTGTNDTLKVRGTIFGDTITVGDAGLSTDAGFTKDVALAGVEHIVISGIEGNDYLSAAGGKGSGNAYASSVTFYGGEGIDKLEGGTSNDILFGGEATDTLLGGDGNDVMVGDEGTDVFDEGDDPNGGDVYFGGIGTAYALTEIDDDGTSNAVIIELAPGHGLTGTFNFYVSGTTAYDGVYRGTISTNTITSERLGTGSAVAETSGSIWVSGADTEDDTVLYDSRSSRIGVSMRLETTEENSASDGAAVSIENIVGDGTNITVTSTAHGLSASDLVTIYGTLGFNGTYTVATVLANSFTIVDSNVITAESVGIAVYENDAVLSSFGVDIVKSGAGDDFLIGSDSANSLYGGSGDDDLDGKGGDDKLYGEAGDDTLRDSGDLSGAAAESGDDNFIGGTGSDTVSYATRGDNLTLTLNGAADDGAAGEADDIEVDVENVVGGSGDDTITGSTLNNKITGGDGDDVLNGGTGDDTFYEGKSGGGNTGSDTIDGGTGNDTVDYSASTIALVVNLDGTAGTGEADALTGIENITGGSGGDTLNGDANANRLIGGPGNDLLRGYGGNDYLDGSDGTDTLDCGAGDGDVGIGSSEIVSIDDNGTDGKLIIQTFAPHGYIAGDSITVYGTVVYNGSYTVESVTNATTFQTTTGEGGETTDNQNAETTGSLAPPPVSCEL